MMMYNTQNNWVFGFCPVIEVLRMVYNHWVFGLCPMIELFLRDPTD
jgi:hypothetical protein